MRHSMSPRRKNLSLVGLAATLLFLCRSAAAAGAGCGRGGAHVAEVESSNKVSCVGLFVDGAANPACAGLRPGRPRGGSAADPWRLLQVRAVLYVPRPVGVAAGTDIYGAKYGYLHRRDLRLIADVLKANTVRLDPWDISADHGPFLELCKQLGLFVIPTFDFKTYANPSFASTQSEILTRIRKDFDTFLSGVKVDDPILAWSLNYGLPLNTTVQLGPRSGDASSPELRAYYHRLCMVRHMHRKHEYSDERQTFRRPLAVPVDLNSRTGLDGIGWYLGFAETLWGQWPDCPFWSDSPTDFGSELGKLRQLGAFDIWIAEGVGWTSEQGAEVLLRSLSQFNASINAKTGSGILWPDPFTRSQADSTGQVFDDCKMSSGCSFPTRKAVIAQFGFSAMIVNHTTLLRQVSPSSQQRLLQKVWYSLIKNAGVEGTHFSSCAAGLIVDEWTDDWDRSAHMGCASNPYVHSGEQDCAALAGGSDIYPEWLGMNGQFSFFSTHCIEPRIVALEKHPAWFSFSCETEELCELKYAAEMYSLCVPLAIGQLFGWLLLPCWAAMALLSSGLLLLCLARLLRLWLPASRCRRRAAAAPLEPPLLGARTARAPRASWPGAQTSAAGARRRAAGPPELPKGPAQCLELEVPAIFRAGAETAYRLELRWDPKRGSRDPSRAMTAARARLFLVAHTEVQTRRLRQQLDCEALALQSPAAGGHLREDAYNRGLVNVHARVMEGYLAWLEWTAKADSEDALVLEAMLRGGGGGAAEVGPEGREGRELGREPSVLYVEALLLRIVESLAEHMLHSPEFVAWLYHQIRWPCHIHTLEAGRRWTFSIDYEALHQGSDAICRNANPYRGGLNFDDINDCGCARMSLRKTFQESPSVVVILDTLSNFQPVFTVKMWVFFAAWFLHYELLTTSPSTRKEGEHGLCVIGQQVMLADAVALGIVELLSLLLGLYQGRCRWQFGRRFWMARRCLYLLVAAGGMFASYATHNLPDAGKGATFGGVKVQFVVAAYWCVRIMAFCGLTKTTAKTPFLPGVPQGRRDTAIRPTMIVRYRSLVWLSMLAGCLVFETFLLAPLVSAFRYSTFCEEGCSLSQNPDFQRILSSSCLSCTGALSFIWLIVGLTALFDLYYIFYLGTAVVGYGIGHGRGLSHILSRAQQQVDLSFGRRSHVAGVGSEGAEISDAAVMRKVFGPAWRMIWSRVAETLYDESLISDADANRMVEAASTVRWKSRDAPSTSMVLSHDKFCKLRFTAKGFRREMRHNGNLLSFVSSGVATFQSTALPPRGLCISALHVRSAPQAQLETLDEDLLESAGPNQVSVFLPEACPLYEVYFSTSNESEGNDPTMWCLEGQVESGEWKELVVQCDAYVPALARRHLEGPFAVELWRQRTSPTSPQGSSTSSGAAPSARSTRSRQLLRLDDLPATAGERLTFLLASLRRLAQAEEHDGVPPGETLLECHPGSLPSLTQIIPCYSETVITDEASLRENDGVNTNLGFIISQYPGEWALFAQKHGYNGKDVYKAFMNSKVSATLSMEVRLWASMRSQTIVRTVAGAMQYHEFLHMLPNLHEDERGIASYARPGQVAEMIVAHQLFGSTKGNRDVNAINDDAVLYLLDKYKDRPIFWVSDYDSREVCDPLRCLVCEFVQEHFGLQPDDAPRYASLMVRCRSGGNGGRGGIMGALEIVEILPRYYPLLIGTRNFMTQGKAANQLSALRFSGGHYIQMMDANMGAFFGEACKVPFILRQFQPSSMRDRKRVACRILGFREVIFTEQHGATGSAMASAEWSFGTICQRFLAGLDVRMHYGHPDFIDAFWASNRGSLSKASPAINLSEDIFAGFNVRMRGERSKHVDMLAWEKGRESSFNAASQFFVKVSKGNVGVMRSRDLKVLTERLDIWDNLSFYFASIAFYLNNWLIDLSIKVYIAIFVLMTMASQTLEGIGELGSMLAAEWVISMGIIAMLPRFMELTLEHGYLDGCIKFIQSVLTIMVMFTFMNKSIAAGVTESMLSGEAKYFATGRPNANTHYTWRECYFAHCRTHYYPALHILLWYAIYASMTREQETAALPMIVIVGTASAWLAAPILFCPQPTFASLHRDLTEYWKFVVASPKTSVRRMANYAALEQTLHADLGDAQSTLYEYWLLDELQHKGSSRWLQFAVLSGNTLVLAALLGAVPAALFIWVWSLFLTFVIHFILMETWRACGRPDSLVLAAFVVVFIFPWIFFREAHVCDVLLGFLILVQGLEVVKDIVLFAARLLLNPDCNWSAMSDKTAGDQERKQNAAQRNRLYDIVVEYLYVSFMNYDLHLMRALMVLLLNLCSQTILVVLDASCGLHSCILLNRSLGVQLGFFRWRKAYEPGSQTDRSVGLSAGAQSATDAALRAGYANGVLA